MEAIQVTKNAYPINDAMNVLFSKLDEAIDDMEAEESFQKRSCGQRLMQFR